VVLKSLKGASVGREEKKMGVSSSFFFVSYLVIIW